MKIQWGNEIEENEKIERMATMLKNKEKFDLAKTKITKEASERINKKREKRKSIKNNRKKSINNIREQEISIEKLDRRLSHLTRKKKIVDEEKSLIILYRKIIKEYTLIYNGKPNFCYNKALRRFALPVKTLTEKEKLWDEIKIEEFKQGINK